MSWRGDLDVMSARFVEVGKAGGGKLRPYRTT
jgi:hypothetical protein